PRRRGARTARASLLRMPAPRRVLSGGEHARSADPRGGATPSVRPLRVLLRAARAALAGVRRSGRTSGRRLDRGDALLARVPSRAAEGANRAGARRSALSPAPAVLLPGGSHRAFRARMPPPQAERDLGRAARTDRSVSERGPSAPGTLARPTARFVPRGLSAPAGALVHRSADHRCGQHRAALDPRSRPRSGRAGGVGDSP